MFLYGICTVLILLPLIRPQLLTTPSARPQLSSSGTTLLEDSADESSQTIQTLATTPEEGPLETSDAVSDAPDFVRTPKKWRRESDGAWSVWILGLSVFGDEWALTLVDSCGCLWSAAAGGSFVLFLFS